MLISVDSLVSAIKLILPSIADYASKTESIWDDAFVKFLQTALDNATFINWLKSVLDTPAVIQTTGHARDAALMAACENCATPEVHSTLESMGVSLVSILPSIVALLRAALAIFGI